MTAMRSAFRYLPFFVLILVANTPVFSQYFGQNKPRYTNFDFKVVNSPHFEVYHYLQDRDELTRVMQWAEQWYKLHENVLKDTFTHKNPLVLYNNHADFQQTSAISGNIGVATGGVTEGLKNRVVMPLAMSNQQTFHVLGHELVHAFQFHMLLSGDSTGLQSLANLPLWIVEGMAEYMSIGRVDAHTALWMRNAVLNDDVPSLRDLSINPKYFPYRYGQAFWSFLTGLYGDEVIRPLFTATAKFGIESAVPLVLGISLNDLSEMWKKSLINYYEPLFKGKKEHPEGRTFLSEENSGQLNIAPVISPNGRYVVYLSEKSIFSTDLFLADVRTGKIVRKVHSQTRSGNVDHLHYLESAGTWSPDSKQFAYVVFSKGRNRLIITDVLTGKKIDEFPLKNVPSFSNPTWSPNGNTIIVNGLVDGQPDLYAINLRTHNTLRLTNDSYAEIQPTFSYDGQRIAFATDRVSMESGRTDGAWKYNLAVMDLETREIENLDIFPGANNMNPVWDEKNNLYFLSDRDGFRNIYRYNQDSSQVIQLTDIITGVTGITRYTPAISVSKDGSTLLYTHYLGENYNVQKAAPDQMDHKIVDPLAVDFTAAVLPPGSTDGKNVVNTALENIDEMDRIGSEELKNQKYKAKFKLDYLGGGGGVGVGTSSTFGTRTGLVGGIDMLFSDVLGYNQIYSSLALNGEIYDFGGQVRYINTRKKIGYGVSLAHIPYRYSLRQYPTIEDVDLGNGNTISAINYPYTTVRYFLDEFRGLTQYTFSRTLRLEANAGYSHYGLRVDQYNNYYVALGSGNNVFPGAYLGEDRERIPTQPGFGMYGAGLALVGDNSSFGLTSPLQGYRYRIGFDQYRGDYDYATVLIDARKYFWFDKFNVSFRGLHYARYGADYNAQQLGAIYVIDPTLVRGYNNLSLSDLDTFGIDFSHVQGPKIAVGNAEIRLPFTGPERLSVIKSDLLITELAAFFDIGVAWDSNNQFGTDSNARPKPIMSTGLAVRVNLFGAFILEPYLARPLQSTAGWTFGLNFVPGW
jgi:Tol biopolymer transport system component